MALAETISVQECSYLARRAEPALHREALMMLFVRRIARHRYPDCAAGFFAAAWLLAAILTAAPAVAQDDTFALRLSRQVTRDDNVFRVPDTTSDPQSAQGISGRSDRIATTTLGFTFDKAYSLQRFRVIATQMRRAMTGSRRSTATPSTTLACGNGS